MFCKGLKEGKVACCGIGPFRRTGCGVAPKFEVYNYPSQYVWFDSGHPVEEVNRQTAKLTWSAPPNVARPYNVKQLYIRILVTMVITFNYHRLI